MAALSRGPLRPLAHAPRHFSSKTVRCLSGLGINSDRLQEAIHHSCQWGAAHRYGRLVTTLRHLTIQSSYSSNIYTMKKYS